MGDEADKKVTVRESYREMAERKAHKLAKDVKGSADKRAAERKRVPSAAKWNA